jgi:hypothetical protein
MGPPVSYVYNEVLSVRPKENISPKQTEEKWSWVFAAGKPTQSGLMFAGKAKSLS